MGMGFETFSFYGHQNMLCSHVFFNFVNRAFLSIQYKWHYLIFRTEKNQRLNDE